MCLLAEAGTWIGRLALRENTADSVDWWLIILLSDLMQLLNDRAIKIAKQRIGAAFISRQLRARRRRKLA